jgi:CHAT domain-containing protein
MRYLFLILPLLAAACSTPPPDAYGSIGGSGRPERAVDLGANAIGESCVQAEGSTATAEIYCGTWKQPSAKVRSAGAADEQRLAALVSSGPWRANLDANYACSAPHPVTLAGAQALQLDCTRRAGGWPQVAAVALSGGQAWLADGVVSSVPAIGRSIAVLSKRATATIVSSAAVDALQAQRLAETGDSRQYDQLMLLGVRANLADDPAAAESAYAKALAVQEKVLGKDDPNLADPVMRLGLQQSIQGRYGEANGSFARADTLITRAAPGKTLNDNNLAPRLRHYIGLHLYNQGKKEEALASLKQADALYEGVAGPDARRAAAASASGPKPIFSGDPGRLQTQQVSAALAGLVEVKRFEGVVLRDLGRTAESDAMLQSAAELARAVGIDQPELMARLRRTAAVNYAASGNRVDAIQRFSDSSRDFARAYPGSRPYALVGLLGAKELVDAGQPDAAIALCRSSMGVMREIKSSFEPERMTPCLDAFAASAGKAAAGPARQALLRDMFDAAQLVQGTVTSQQIQEVARRLAEGSSNSEVGRAIRRKQDAANALAEVRRRRAEAADAQQPGGANATDAQRLEEQERNAAKELADSEGALQAADPNYNQLVQQATSAQSVLDALHPGEAFASVMVTPDGGWTFLLRDGEVRVGRVPGGAKTIDPLVAKIRDAMSPRLPPFDVAASQTLYKTVFGDVASGLDGVTSLTVAPSGGLLALPFAVLLTGPADPNALGAAPWLIRRMAIGHVPSAGNFVALRGLVGKASAPQPWFGFGGFQNVSLAQARRSFPASCGDSAEALAHLTPLMGALKELDLARQLLGASTDNELLGAAFTAKAVPKQNLIDYRVIHYATHGLLPSDLACLKEPALVTSPPPGAVDASGALLLASDVAQIKSNADLVILSACNSGGLGGSAVGGESLSTLARSFFYGGARALLVTHWEANDSAASFLVADTLRRSRENPRLGYAGALRDAQVFFLDRAGSGLPKEFAHPYAWAPFALMGQAGAPPAPATTASRL